MNIFIPIFLAMLVSGSLVYAQSWPGTYFPQICYNGCCPLNVVFAYNNSNTSYLNATMTFGSSCYTDTTLTLFSNTSTNTTTNAYDNNGFHWYFQLTPNNSINASGQIGRFLLTQNPTPIPAPTPSPNTGGSNWAGNYSIISNSDSDCCYPQTSWLVTQNQDVVTFYWNMGNSTLCLNNEIANQNLQVTGYVTGNVFNSTQYTISAILESNGTIAVTADSCVFWSNSTSTPAPTPAAKSDNILGLKSFTFAVLSLLIVTFF
jgi:hypothetical protein